MDLIVRDARPEDAALIVKIFNPIISAGLHTVFDRPFTEDDERRYIEALPPRGIFHVAVRVSDGAILGFQSMEPFATYTGSFDHVGVIGTYVDANHRGQGVAQTLFDATFAAARRKGYEKLFTYIRSDNPAALAAYGKQGFRVVGIAERHAKVEGRYIDEVIVERFL
ncbi:MAG: GNAT family N-acetyltransferase [Acidobacteria bacterium]|nr:MAG: GNAT family N-acetyltransferase [Acidobacteriota bacterium]